MTDLQGFYGNILRREAEENHRKAERHGWDFPVALQRRWEVSRKYGIFATPVAFLIDEEGVIADDVAKGTEEILALATRVETRRQEVAHALAH